MHDCDDVFNLIGSMILFLLSFALYFLAYFGGVEVGTDRGTRAACQSVHAEWDKDMCVKVTVIKEEVK